MTEYDFSNGLTATPRVSSISASQALLASSTQNHATSEAVDRSIRSGLDSLDDALCAPTATSSTPQLSSTFGGIPRGSISEVYGPPGVGKTAFSLNLAAKVLTAGNDEKVVWIDTGSPIPTVRLKDFLIGNLSSRDIPVNEDREAVEKTLDDCASRFFHFRASSLAHLISLFAHPPPHFPPQGTALLVVDTISAPFQSYFPNATEIKSRLGLKLGSNHPLNSPLPGQQQHARTNQSAPTPERHQLQWLLNRKWNVASDMVTKITKLIANYHQQHGDQRQLAVILLNQTHTKIKGQPQPTLYPALAGGSWENHVHTRIVLYRDFNLYPSHRETSTAKIRFAEVMKRGGKVISARTDANIVPFVIEKGGLREIHPVVNNDTILHEKGQEEILLQRSSPPLASSQSMPTPTFALRKRKVDEIADSEDDEEEIGEDDFDLLDAVEDELQWDKQLQKPDLELQSHSHEDEKNVV